jgi:hypothetical protein
MSTITTIAGGDKLKNSRSDINTNFSNLNTDKAEKSGQVFTGAISFSGTTHAGIKVNSLTTAQRDALTPANGMIIYNTTSNRLESYENGAWQATIESQYITLTYGETLAVNDAVYLKASDGFVYKADADASATADTFIGFAKDAGNLGVSGRIQIVGKVTGLTGLTTGSYYFISGTAGALSTSAGTIRVQAGLALSTTTLLIEIDKINVPIYKTGVSSRDTNTASGNQTIAHGLGRIPKGVRFKFSIVNPDATNLTQDGIGTYDGTNMTFQTIIVNTDGTNQAGTIVQNTTTVFTYTDNSGGFTGSYTATATFDATNITLAWVKTSSPTGTVYFVWEAFA